MITLIWRSDAHLADTPPQSRTDDWTSSILDKVLQVGEIARREKAVAVLDGGDFFHVKAPSRNSHELVRRTAEAHVGYPCPVYATIGNHDVKYGNLEYLTESPLAVLYETGVFRRLYDQYEALFEVGGLKVRVVGIPYHGSQYDMNRFTTITKGDENWLVAVVHCLASPTGGTFFEGEDVLKYSDLANLAPDVWLLGHYHGNQGIQKVGKKPLVSIGSLSRGALTQEDLNRQPSVAILKFDKKTVDIKVEPLNVRPAKEIFDLAGKTRSESRKQTMETLITSIQTTLTQRPEGSLLETIRNLPGIHPMVRERTLNYLERVGGK